MLEKPSLATRIVIGKGAGFAVGLAGFLLLPVLVPEAGFCTNLQLSTRPQRLWWRSIRMVNLGGAGPIQSFWPTANGWRWRWQSVLDRVTACG